MALMWGLAVPLPTHLSLILLGFLVYGIWVLFSWYWSQTQVAAKTETSSQHNLKHIQKLTVSQLEEAEMNIIATDLTCIPGLPVGWTQEYVFWSIDRSLRRIFQHLENARSTLLDLNLPESRPMSSSSISDIVLQEVIPPCCYCKKGKLSDFSSSSGSSHNSSSLCYLPILSEGKAWQFQSSSVTVSSQKEPSVPRSHGTSLPTFQLTDPEKSDLQNLPVLPPLQGHNSCISSILESLDPCKQEKMKDKRKTHFLLDHGPNSILNESPGHLEWAPMQLHPSLRDLEGHMCQKVSTLRQQTVPLPVKKSWDILNHFMDEQGAPEQELPQTHSPTLIPQSAEQNTNRSPDLPSFHLHVNIGVNSELNRTEAKLSPPLTSNAQFQSEENRQALGYNPLVISMDTPSHRNLGVNIILEDNALSKKDPKHVLEPSIEQRVIGLPKRKIQPHTAQVTNMALTPKIPCSTSGSIKITPLALLQVMDTMGMIPESHSEVIDSVGFSPQPPNQAETVSITPRPLNQVTESQSPQHQTMESKNMALRLNQVSDTTKVTPVALFHVMDSMGMINELHPHVIEPAGTAPKPQYQVMESAKMDTLYNHQAIRPGDMNLATPGAQQMMDFMQIIPPGQPYITGSRTLIQGSNLQHENLTLVSAHPNVLTSSTIPVETVESRIVPPQPLFQVLEPSGVTLLPSGQSLHAQKVTPIVQVSPTGMITPVQVVECPGFNPQPVAQEKEYLEMPTSIQFQVGDSVGMTSHQGTEYVSLTPAQSHQVMDPLKFTSWHQDLNYSNVSSRQSQEMTGTMGLTSDTCLQMKNPVDMIQSHHQIMESTKTIPAPPDQGTVPIGMSQKHHNTEAEIGPVIPLLQEMNYLGGKPIPQPTVMDPMNFSPELQNVKSEHLIPDPRLKNMKSVDMTMDLVSELVNSEPPMSSVVHTNLAPELNQQNPQLEESALIPQLQSETSVPSAPESQLQVVKSGQLTIEPQLQNTQSAGLAPDPQLQSNKSVHLISGSESQGIEDVHSALSQEIQGDIKMVTLTPGPSLEDSTSVNLAPKPCSQNTSSDNITHVLEDAVTSLVECRSLIPDMLVESTQLYATKSLKVSPRQSYHSLEPKALSLQHQAEESRATSETCHQADESELMPPSGLTPVPLSQTSESVEMSLPPLQDSLETRTQIGKEMEEALESQNATKVTLNLLTELQVQSINSGVMSPEPQPSDVKFVHVTLEPCSEVTNPSEKTLRPEHEDTETTSLALPKVDGVPKTAVEPYSEMGSLELSLEPGVQDEKSESLAQILKSAEVVTEQSVLVVEPTELTVGHKPHIKDAISEPQPHEVKSRKMDTESQLQNEKSVNVIQQIPIGEVDPEKTKPEPGLQSLPLKELTEGAQPPDMTSVDLNLDPQQLSVQYGLVPGPQLQSVKFPRLYQEILLQGENPVNFISDSPHYGVKSDEAISCSPVPEIRPLDFIPRPKIPEPQPQPQHVKPVEVNVGPCLQDVRFSDLIPEPKQQHFKYVQLIPGVQLQDRKSLGLIPEPFLSLKQDSQVEDRDLLPPTEVSEFHSMKLPIPASELQYPSVIPEEVNPGVSKFSDLASGPKRQGVKLGEPTPGSLFPGMSSMTAELGTHDPKLAKVTPGLQGTRQVSFKSGPWLQDVHFFDVIPGTQPQGMETSELNSGKQLEHVKFFDLTTQPERQGMKPESLLQDIKNVTGNQVPSFVDRMAYKLTSEPQIQNTESMKLTPGIHLASLDHSELTRRLQAQDIVSSELIHGPHLGCIKPAEKITASKQEELTPGPHLGDMKFMGLMSKSELGKGKSILSAPGINAGGKELGKLPPGFNLKGLKSELSPSRSLLEDRKSAVLTLGKSLEIIKSTVVSPSSSQLEGIKSMELIPGSGIQDLKTVGLVRERQAQDVNVMGLKLEPKKQGESTVNFVPGMLLYDKSMGVLQGPQLKVVKPKELTSQPQMQDKKHMIVSCWKQQNLKPVDIDKTQGIQEAKFVDLVSTQECQGLAPMDLNLEPGQDDQITVNSPEWKDGAFDQLSKQSESEDMLSMRSDQEPKPAYIKSIEVNSEGQFQDTPSFDLAPEPVVYKVKGNEFQYEPLVPSLKPCQVTTRSQVHQVEVLEPPIQTVKIMAPNREPQMESTKSVQWIPISEFQSEKRIGSNFRLYPQSARPTDLKLSTQWRGVRPSELAVGSNFQGEKSVGFHLEPQLQKVKSFPLAQGLQKTKTFHLPSASQPQGIKTIELNREPQIGSVRSIQWIPGPEFQGVKLLGLNCRSRSQGVKSTERKPSTQLGGVKTSEMTPGPKLQGEKSVDFNLGPQVQCIKTPVTPSESDMQKGENFASISELQSQCVKSVALHYGPQLENTKSVQRTPVSDYQVKKFMLNLRPQSQDVIAKELRPSIWLRNDKISDELTTRPKLQGTQPSGSTQEHQSHRFNTTDLKSELHVRNMKACDPALRSKTNNIKSTFKPRFHLEDTHSPGLNPGIQPQEVKSLGSPSGSKPQVLTSLLFKQDSESSEAIYGVVSQQPQSQNDLVLESEKSSELVLQTKPQGMKSEVNSGPQWQWAKYSDLTSEKESQNMKCTKLSPSSHFSKLAMGPKIQSVKLNYKAGPKWKGLKSNSVLRKKPQEMEDCESCPQLQDLKSSRTIVGIKVQDVKSMDFGPGPHLEDMASEVVTEKRVHGVKSIKTKPSSKLQAKKPDFTQRKMVLDTKLVELDSRSPLQDLKYPELIMDRKLQGLNSMRQHVTGIKSSEMVTRIQSQDVKAADFHSGPQTQNKKPSELAQGKMLQYMESIEFSQDSKLQGVTVESKPQNEQSVKLNSGPQLQDENYSKSILRIKLEDGRRSLEVSSGLRLQGTKSSEVIPEDMLQKEKLVGSVGQPLWQDVKSLKWPFCKAHARRPLQLETPQEQDRKLFMLTPELHLQGLKPEAINSGSKLKGMKSELTIVQTMKDMGINHGAELQVVGLSEQASDSTIYSVVPSELNVRNQRQDGKAHNLSQKQQLQSIKPIAFSYKPHLQHIKSPELSTKLQDLKSMKFSSEQQFQDVKSSELGLGTNMQSLEFNSGPQMQEIKPSEVCTKLLNESSLEFKHEPRLQGRAPCGLSPESQIHCKNILASNTGIQNVESSELYPSPDFQDIKSKVLCIGPHLEDVNSACIPNANSQYINSSGYKPEPCLQDINSSACTPEPDLQCVNSVCKPGPHWHGMNSSACILGSKTQYVDSTGYNHKPNLQDENSSVCTLGPSPQCENSSVCTPGPSPQYVYSSVCTPGPSPQGVNSSVCTPGPSPQGVNSSVCTPGPSPQGVNSSVCTSRPSTQCVNSSVCTPGPSPQCVNSSVCTSGPSPQCVNSSVCTPGPSPQGVNSSVCTPGPSPQCVNSSVCTSGPSPPHVNSTECSFEAHFQGVNQWTSILGPKIQCVDSPGYNPKSHLQGVNSSACTLGQNPQHEHSIRYNLGSLPQDMNPCTFPAPQIMCVNSLWCDTRTHLQDVNSSARTLRQDSQSVNSTVYNPEPHLQAPKLQGVKFSELNPGTEIKREMPIIVDPAQHLQDLKLELTPESNIRGVVPVEYNPGVSFSELNPGLNSMKLSSEPRLKNMKSFEMTRQSESQCTKSVLLNSEPPFQGVKSPNVVGETKFQDIPFLKNQCGSWQQTAQPMFALRPQSSGMKSVGILPALLSEDRMFPEMSKQPLLCENSIKLTPGYGLQGLRSKNFSPEPCFQKVRSVPLKPGSQSQSVNSSVSTRKFLEGPPLSSVRFSNLISESQQQCMKSPEFISETRWQNVKHVKLSPVSLSQTGNSMELSPRLFLQNVTSGNQIPQTSDQITEFSNVLYRPGHQLEDSAETNTKMSHQFSKLANFISLPVYQNVGSPEMTIRLGHKSTETIETSMRLTPKPTDKVIESVRMPLKSDPQTPEFVDLNSTLSDPEKNFGIGIFQSPESYKDTIMMQPSALPMVLPSDKIGNTVGTLYPEIWEVGVISKEATEKKQMEAFGNSLESYSPYSLRLLPSEFQAGLGARRNPIRPFLGRQQNVWESHVCRQRLPRKYLSNMLMLGNVLGTTMERKICSESFLTEGDTMDICRSIEKLFGVPAELMEFSQSLLERGPRTISQTSMVKNYIQRHILCHGHEKRMPLKMWTRGSTSSIIQQYSGTRLGIKKTSSKLSDILQEYATQHMPVSCIGAQFPALVKPESSPGVLYDREDPVPVEQSKKSQSSSPTRTLESHHSLKASYPSQAKTAISEQLHMLKELQLQVAAKLLRSQIPHNVPPPLASGLVLKYPICLQCGRWSGFNCSHKIQSSLGPYLLIYPQLHLLRTPEGQGEIRLHLGFRLQSGKRPQVSKYRRRSRSETWKHTAPPSRRKPRSPGFKSPTRHFQPRSSQSPTSVPAHIRQKQRGNHGAAGKTVSEHYEFCHVHSLSESGFESNQDERWAKLSLRKTSDLKYPMKKMFKGLKTQNVKLYHHSRNMEESPGMFMDHSRSRSIETTHIYPVKRQPKKSSQPKFMQMLFQGLRQTFQKAQRIVAIARQKPRESTRIDNLWSRRNLYARQNAKDYCLVGDGKEATIPVIQPRLTGSISQQEDGLQEIIGGSYTQAQQLQQVRADQQNTMVTTQPSSLMKPLGLFQNISGRANNYSDEISSPEPKNCSKAGAKFQVQERRILQSHFKDAHKEEQHGFFRERALCNKPSERTYHSLSVRMQQHRGRRYRSPQRKHSSPSDRTLRTLSDRSHHSPERNSSPSVRTLQSFSDKNRYNLSKGRGRSPSGRRRSPVRSPRGSPSGRRARSPPDRRRHSPSPNRLSFSRRGHHSPIRRTRVSPEKSRGSFSERSPSRPSDRKKYSSSGRAHHSPSRSRLYCIHSERTHYSLSESRHSHSERSYHSHLDSPHHRPVEGLRHGSPKEKPECLFI